MDLFQLREQFSREGIMMCFNGPFSHSIIEEMGNAIRNYLAAEDLTKVAVQDVFAVYIEMSQNARNYLISRKISTGDLGSATIMIARHGDNHAISSCNVILKQDIAPLSERIDHINSLDRDGLKKLVRQQLRAETAPGAMGAGIGLMEMAKRSGQKLDYSFRDVNAEHSFFTLTVIV